VNPFFREVDLIVRDIGHMDYLNHPVILELANKRLQMM